MKQPPRRSTPRPGRTLSALLGALFLLTTTSDAATVSAMLVLQHGSPVLRRDEVGLRWEHASRREAEEAAAAWVSAFQREGTRAESFQDVCRRVVVSLGMPSGVLVERVRVEISGALYFERRLRLVEAPLLAMGERSPDGRTWTNYYHYSLGWRLFPSDNPITWFMRPSKRFFHLPGIPWSPPLGARSRTPEVSTVQGPAAPLPSAFDAEGRGIVRRGRP